MTTNIVRLEKFMGVDFEEMAKKKMLFLFTTLNIAYIIFAPRPKEKGNEKVEEMHKRNEWDNDDFICHGHILKGMVDYLFNVY